MARRSKLAGKRAPEQTAGESSNGSPVATSPAAPAGDALLSFAQDLGTFLGTVQGRATAWLDQRKGIADQLTQIRDTADQYLQQLTGDSVPAVRRGRHPGRPKGATAAQPNAESPAPQPRKRGRRRKPTMSPEARARIAEAQRKRWAKFRREQGR